MKKKLKQEKGAKFSHKCKFKHACIYTSSAKVQAHYSTKEAGS